jgi:hypothetical protein
MIKFSIKRAIKFSFSEYVKHPLLLSVSAVCVGLVCWFSRALSLYVTRMFGMSEMIGLSDILQGQSLIEGNQLNMAALYTYIAESPARELFLQFLILVLVGALFAFIFLGCARVCLALKDNDEGSFSLLMKNPPVQVGRFLAAYAVVGMGLLAASFFIGEAALPFFAVCRNWFGGALAAPIFAFASVGAIGLLMYCFVASALLVFVVVDKPYTGVRGILRTTHELFYESSGRIFKTFFVMFSLVLLLVFVVTGIINLVCAECAIDQETTHRLIQGASILISYPLFLLCGAYMYRWINPKLSRG